LRWKKKGSTRRIDDRRVENVGTTTGDFEHDGWTFGVVGGVDESQARRGKSAVMAVRVRIISSG